MTLHSAFWEYELNSAACISPAALCLCFPFAALRVPNKGSCSTSSYTRVTPRLFPVHTLCSSIILSPPRLPNPRGPVDSASIFTQTLCGPFFPQKPLYETDMRREGQVLHYALILPRRELKSNAFKWLIQDHISSQQRSQYKKLEPLTTAYHFTTLLWVEVIWIRRHSKNLFERNPILSSSNVDDKMLFFSKIC